MKPQQIAQQVQQVAKQELQKTASDVFEQVTGGVPDPAASAVQAAQPVTEAGANVEEIKHQEQAKLAQLRQMLDQEMQSARQSRGQSAQEYNQQIDQQLEATRPRQEEQPAEVPTSQAKGPPAAVQAKQGSREVGKSHKG